ncbi:myelin regulatory factor-like isoform X1 [Argiope bruennichi]|uniref:myelin regulatory factor-like isoform X1 n=1 Tax=Argiope bruennichi TaxID=94029 RepID=UPI0024948779|nr:myelin regulatory factor-like isoform X1 [Argiope bruennichi]
MFPFGRGDLGAIDSEAFDFSQLEEYINDDNESNIYFHDALVTSSDLKLSGSEEKTPPFSRNGQPGMVKEPHAPHKNFRASDVTSSFNKPHHLPDSPPDSGSEPPFSPPNEDPKLKCPSLDMLHQPQQHLPSEMAESLKHHYLHYGLPQKHAEVSISSSTSPTSPHHPVSPVHSTHSASMPVLAPPSLSGLSQISSFVPSAIPQQLITPGLGHLYAGSEEFLYENISNPVSSTTSNKKRKLPESPKIPRTHQSGNGVQVKIEPSIQSPDPTTVLPSSEDDYNFELSAAEANALFVDSNFQCIRFQPFQPNTWAQLLDRDMKEIASPNFRVDADKGFNYSNADESFVCQKKNHFQVTVHVQPVADAHYVRTPEGTRPIEKFSLNFHGVKMESPTQTIKVEQSQSDRSKRPFHPVPLEMVRDQVTKTTVGRLHFSETTSNNMRKKGKPNPDQRFFFLVVSLCAHVSGETPVTVIAHSSEKIIVRASNPGQFENDMELSWQKGHTLDSIFHNGRVGINTDRPEEALVVHGNIKVTGHILQPSDLRAKYDIHELDTRQQLRNVSNLRIVRYRYLPEFGEEAGLGQMGETGVIAQEVQHILPEAVREAGDVRLTDGHVIEKLLVVNKERIFMENVGAVKELCKVTDNLETRIDELERINRKLTSMKRKDSLKSTATDLSRMGSVTSHGKHRCHRSCDKQRSGSKVSSCSSHFIQSSIFVLVVIMACCLMALATLYIMEWQNQHNSPYFRGAVLIQMKSPSAENATLQSNVPFMSTLFPSISLSSQASFLSSRKSTPDKTQGATPKYSTKSVLKPVYPTGNPDDRFYGSHLGDLDCSSTEECPIYCCDYYPDLTLEEEGHEEEGLLRHHIEKKSGSSLTFAERQKLLRHQKTERASIDRQTSKDSMPESSPSESSHKLKKRMIEAEDESADNNPIFRSESEPILYLAELNATLLPELCSEERLEENSNLYVFCSIYISRHFPHVNITLQIRSKDSDTLIEFCGGNHQHSCPREVLPDSEDPSSNSITKRDIFPQSRSWQLPVGSFVRSRYRFRMMSRRFSTDQQICTMNSNFRPFTEYILTFQRRCDK